MGSGSFPLSPNEETGKKLVQAAALIKEVTDAWYDDVYGGDSGGMQYDNAATDGGSLALLGLAHRLILGEVKEVKR